MCRKHNASQYHNLFRCRVTCSAEFSLTTVPFELINWVVLYSSFCALFCTVASSCACTLLTLPPSSFSLLPIPGNRSQSNYTKYLRTSHNPWLTSIMHKPGKYLTCRFFNLRSCVFWCSLVAFENADCFLLEVDLQTNSILLLRLNCSYIITI